MSVTVPADASVPTSALFQSIAEQVVWTCTSSTQPPGVEGRVIYETDTNYLRIYNGGWKLLAGAGTYTPTLVGMAIGTGGSAANAAAWTYMGNADGNGELRIEGGIVFGTAGTTFPAATITASLPTGFTAISTDTQRLLVGQNEMLLGVTGYVGPCRLESSTTVRFMVNNASATYLTIGSTSTLIPGTWAAGDALYWSVAIRCTAP